MEYPRCSFCPRPSAIAIGSGSSKTSIMFKYCWLHHEELRKNWPTWYKENVMKPFSKFMRSL